jgi:hypothetical protein
MERRIRTPLQRALTRILLVTALAAQIPLRAQELAVPASDAAISKGPAWADFSAAELRAALPGLSLLVPPSVSDNPSLKSMARMLDRSVTGRIALASVAPKAQAEAIRTQIAAELRGLAEGPQIDRDDDDASLPDQIAALDARRSSLEDARAVLPLIFSGGAPELLLTLEKERSAAAARLQEKKEALVRRMINDSDDWGAPAWHGRTAVFSLADGNKLAVKFRKKYGASLDDEIKGMERAHAAGVSTPVPLGLVNSSFPGAGAWLAKMKMGTDFLPYLLPKKSAADFFSYLGAELPADFHGNKSAAIGDAAARSMRDMVLLADRGFAHRTLAPMSHSEASWDWNYFRWNINGYGPTSIHSWKKGLSYANLRMSGIADFEHIGTYDPATAGQNLTEWSLLVMLAGASNGLPVAETADILWHGYELHAASRIDPDSYLLDSVKLHRRLLAAANEFYRFHRRSAALPRWVIDLRNRLTGMVSVGTVERGEPLIMPGSTVRKLILDVVYPYFTALKGGAPGKWDDLRYELKHSKSWMYAAMNLILYNALIPMIVLTMSAAFIASILPPSFGPFLIWTAFIMSAARFLAGVIGRASIPRWVRSRPRSS